MTHRVVITGMGAISPLGIGRESVADSLLAGQSGIRPIERFDTTPFSLRLGGEVRGFRPTDFISARTVRRMDRLSTMVTAAARMAVEDARIDLENRDSSRMGIVMGTAYGATDVASRRALSMKTGKLPMIRP